MCSVKVEISITRTGHVANMFDKFNDSNQWATPDISYPPWHLLTMALIDQDHESYTKRVLLCECYC